MNTHKSAHSKWKVLPEIGSPNRLIVRAICHMLWLAGGKDSKRLATSAVTRVGTQNLKTSCFSQLWNVCTICRECKYTRSNGEKANCWKDWAQKKMLVMRKNLWGCRGEMTLLLKIYWMQTVFTVIPKGTTPPLHYQLHHWTQHGVHVLIGGSDEVFLWSNPSSSRRTSVRQ